MATESDRTEPRSEAEWRDLVAALEREHAETVARLAESERRYREVVEMQTELVVRQRPNGRVTFVNEAYCRWVGRPRSLVLDPDWNEISVLSEKSRKALFDHFAKFSPEAPVHAIELETGENGRPLFSHWVDTGIFDPEGRLIEVQAVGRDVTERVMAERAREEAERLRRAALEAALDGYIGMDAEGRIVEFNPAAERIFGHAREAVLGRPVHEVLVPGHSRTAHVDGLREHLASGRSRMLGRTVEVTALHALGHEVPIEIVVQRSDKGGRPTFLAYLRDLTERRRAEAEIARQREDLHQSEKLTAMGTLLAGVAHELNNPLSVVVGYAAMLREFATDAGTLRRAEKIHEAAERCSRIVRSFLAMARKRPPTQTPVDPAEMVRGALELTAYALRSAGVEVELDLPDKLPPVPGDPDQLPQVVINLVTNAQAALLEVEGPRRLRVSARPVGGAVEIEVADNGPGMTPEVAARAFEPFFTTKDPGAGTGVGLSITRGIVEAHRGTLEVETAPGKGARFVVTLPVAEQASPVAAPDQRPPGVGARVLIVDDEDVIAEMLAEVVARDGHRPAVAASAEEALERLRAEPFDLVLSDLRMPGLGGPGLWRAISAEWPALARKTLFVTGDALSPEVGRFVEAARVPLLEKPLDPRVVRAAVAARLAGDGP